jgi:hypothetical protein
MTRAPLTDFEEAISVAISDAIDIDTNSDDWARAVGRLPLVAAALDLFSALTESIPVLERAATEEARANLAPTGLPKVTPRHDLLARARAATEKAEGHAP